MPFPPEVEAARAQVFQQIGRNVLRFQRLELILKSMVAGSRINITAGESPTAHELRIQAIDKKMLGLVSGQFFEELISNQPAEEDPPSVVNGPNKPKDKAHMSIAFSIHFPPEAHAAWKQRVHALITERNELIHKSLLCMELETLSGCQKALAALENQGARVLVEIDQLKPIIGHMEESLEESRELLRAHMTDDAFGAQ